MQHIMLLLIVFKICFALLFIVSIIALQIYRMNLLQSKLFFIYFKFYP
ncbi:MAG: hypothetical protein JWP12_2249 [Bacteroidetes bacterium]|nr:hypothetical protein [Bacteroidota bacterium]